MLRSVALGERCSVDGPPCQTQAQRLRRQRGALWAFVRGPPVMVRAMTSGRQGSSRRPQGTQTRRDRAGLFHTGPARLDLRAASPSSRPAPPCGTLVSPTSELVTLFYNESTKRIGVYGLYRGSPLCHEGCLAGTGTASDPKGGHQASVHPLIRLEGVTTSQQP